MPEEEMGQENEIFEKTGIKYQMLIQVASIYLATTICWNFFISIFTGEGAGWKCVDNSTSRFCRENINVTFLIDNKDFDVRCELNMSEWTYNVPKTYSFVTEFDLVCARTSIAALVSSAYYIGGFFGSMVAGMISDNFGRKSVLIVSILGTIISSICGSLSPNVWVLFALNILVGGCSVACFSTLYVYQLEYVPPSFRAISGALMQLGITLSGVLLDGFAYYIRYWRHLKVYTSLPCILSLVAIVIFPESPRWLLSTGKVDKAKKVIARICRFNGQPAHVDHLTAPSVTSTQKYNYTHLFRPMKVFVITARTAILWFTMALVTYALLMVTANIGGNFYATFALTACGNFPAYVLVPYVSQRFGFKKSNLGFLAGTGILVGSMALVPTESPYKYNIDVSLMIVSAFFTGTAFTLLYTWTFEIFPTPIRAQGMSACIIFERIGVILVPFITRVMQRIWFALPYVIMCVLALSASLVGIGLPETHGKPTREKYEEIGNDNNRGVEIIKEEWGM